MILPAGHITNRRMLIYNWMQRWNTVNIPKDVNSNWQRNHGYNSSNYYATIPWAGSLVALVYNGGYGGASISAGGMTIKTRTYNGSFSSIVEVAVDATTPVVGSYNSKAWTYDRGLYQIAAGSVISVGSTIGPALPEPNEDYGMIFAGAAADTRVSFDIFIEVEV